jgi:hypothetical protein
MMLQVHCRVTTKLLIMPIISMVKIVLVIVLALLLPLPYNVFADHGEEVLITLDNTYFRPLSLGEGNQCGVFVSYTVKEPSIAGQMINAVMEVYAPNGTLIRTSSYPSGFIAQSSGGKAELKTTFTDDTVQSVTANVMFTNLQKTQTISNELTVKVNLTSLT